MSQSLWLLYKDESFAYLANVFQDIVYRVTQVKSNALPAEVCQAPGALFSRDETQGAGDFGSVPEVTEKRLNQIKSRECSGGAGVVRIKGDKC